MGDGPRALPMSGMLQVTSPQAGGIHTPGSASAGSLSPSGKIVRLGGSEPIPATRRQGVDLDEFFFDNEAVHNRLRKPWRRKEVIKVLDKRIHYYKERHNGSLDDRGDLKFAHQARELKLLSKVQEEDEQRNKMTLAEQETAAVIQHGHREFVDFAIDEVERPLVKKVEDDRRQFEWAAAGAAHRMAPVLAGSMKVNRISTEDDEDIEYLGFSRAPRYDSRIVMRAPPPSADAFQVDFVRDFVDPDTLLQDSSAEHHDERPHSSNPLGSISLPPFGNQSRGSFLNTLTVQAQHAADVLRATTSSACGRSDGGLGSSHGFTHPTGHGTQGSNWYSARRFGMI